MDHLRHLWNKLVDFRVTIVLLLIFACAIAVATFVENEYGTDTAKALIYNARWMELLYLLLALNLIGNIIRLKLWRAEKRLSGLFHASFLLILLGAALTRYMGYEGTMHIREGKSENRFLSAETYLSLGAVVMGEATTENFPLQLSALGSNSFDAAITTKGGELRAELKEYIPAVNRKLAADETGRPIVQMTVSNGKQAHDLFLEANQSTEDSGIAFSFERPEENLSSKTVYLFPKEGRIYILSGESLRTLDLATQTSETLKPGFVYPLKERSIYSLGTSSFVIRQALLKGHVVMEKLSPSALKQGAQSALTLRLFGGGIEKTVTLLGSSATLGNPVTVQLGTMRATLSYGSIVRELPYHVRLDKFLLTRYPGSDSPSSYESSVTIEEPTGDFAYRIYMNHILDHKGFRLFQSSYDQDEMGTILSVAHDPGKWPTYLGYLLLVIGLFGTLFSPQSRFAKLATSLKTVAPASVLLLFFWVAPAHAIENSTQAQDVVKMLKSYDKEAADAFGELLVQDFQGRLKPIDTLAHEVVAKVSRNADLFGLASNQIMLGMLTRPQLWQEVKMIRIGHPGINHALGLAPEERMAAFSDFFDYTKPEIYKLKPLVEEANRKRPALRSKFDTELLKIDERVNVCYMVYTGVLLRIIPKIDDPKETWYNPADAIQTFDTNTSEAVRAMLGGYFNAVDYALEKGDWNAGAKYLALLKTYQMKAGAGIYPTPAHIQAEIIYNRIAPFETIGTLLGVVGFLLFVAALTETIKASPLSIMAIRYGRVVLWGLFGLYTAALGLRWYISGHAPWSDGYESMIYIGWTVILATQIFGRYSSFVPGVGALMGGIVLFVAHLGWLDPQITNLVPVLKSYWLNIHVSMITASYGFLGLGSLLGAVALLLFALRHPTKPQIDDALLKLLKIDEMALIAGLALLTVGNFIGGVWANESWGRYWGWDPKETWALATILVYAAIVHQRFIPRLATPFAFAVSSTLGIATVIMTYFGVNYYLSGLHSYAAGDPIPVPMWIYVVMGIVVALITAAARNRHIDHRL